ncbi:putative allophanate hydrolase subunit 2 [Escherichia coli]|nr:putative allophanate hydrolase subunit 2 [Escherichia coli]
MLKIIRAGMYTTVQDGGRHGFRQSGISHWRRTGYARVTHC